MKGKAGLSNKHREGLRYRVCSSGWINKPWFLSQHRYIFHSLMMVESLLLISVL